MTGASDRSGKRTRLTIAALTAVVGSVLSPARGQCQYEVTIIQAPTCPIVGPPATDGLGINELGHVVGYYQQCEDPIDKEAFLWTPAGGLVTLPRPPGVYSAIAVDINDVGVIVGTYTRSGVGFRGFVYDTKTGEWTELPPVVQDGAGWSSARAINNAGQVVGWRSIGPDLIPQNAFIWSAKDGFLDLGVMNGPTSAATCINEFGEVAGSTGNGGSVSEAFLWHDGALTLLGPIPGGLTTTANAIAEDGAIVGAGRVPMDGYPNGLPQGFLWKGGEFTLLGTLPNHAASGPGDIRTANHQVVGLSSFVDGDPNVRHGFIWQNNVMTNLNDLVPPNPGLTIRAATAISETSGHVLSYGLGPGGNVTFLLTPVAGPAGDLDLDCRVDVLDLLGLLKSWGACPAGGDCGADLNGDGTVDCLDLLMLLENWG